jgi:hypothetical protein
VGDQGTKTGGQDQGNGGGTKVVKPKEQKRLPPPDVPQEALNNIGKAAEAKFRSTSTVTASDVQKIAKQHGHKLSVRDAENIAGQAAGVSGKQYYKALPPVGLIAAALAGRPRPAEAAPPRPGDRIRAALAGGPR